MAQEHSVISKQEITSELRTQGSVTADRILHEAVVYAGGGVYAGTIAGTAEVVADENVEATEVIAGHAVVEAEKTIRAKAIAGGAKLWADAIHAGIVSGNAELTAFREVRAEEISANSSVICKGSVHAHEIANGAMVVAESVQAERIAPKAVVVEYGKEGLSLEDAVRKAEAMRTEIEAQQKQSWAMRTQEGRGQGRDR